MLGRAPTPLLPAERTRARMPGRLGMPRGPLTAKLGELGIVAFDLLPADDREVLSLAAFARAIGLVLGSDAVVIERHDPSRRDADEGAPLGCVADALPIVLTGALRANAVLAQRARHALDAARTHRAFDRAKIDRVFEQQLTSRPIALGEFGFSFVDSSDDSAAEAFLLGEPWNALRLNVIASKAGSKVLLVADSDAIDEEQVDRVARTFSEELANLLATDTSAWRAKKIAIRPHEAPPVRASRTTPSSPQIILRRGGLLPVSMQQDWLLSSLADARTTDVFRRFWVVSRAYWIGRILTCRC